MCELLGASFAQPADLSGYLELFFQRSEYHPHGWGIGYYPPGSRCAAVAKEPVKAADSDYARYMARRMQDGGRLLVAHIRKASFGEHTLPNTHPFARECGGAEYLFAHNGGIPGYQDFLLGRHRPMGETDSEHLFCSLLAAVEDMPAGDRHAALHALFRQYNAHGRFNCILSDGGALYCYHDKDGFNGLHYLEAQTCGNRGVIVSTTPLTDEAWVPFDKGGMLVVENGGIVIRRA